MKIGIVCFNLEWQAGGTRLIYSLAHALQRLGNQVIIYAPAYNPEAFPEMRNGLTITVVPPRQPMEWTRKPKGVFQKVKHKIQQERLQVDTARRIAEVMDLDLDVVNPHDFAYKVSLFYKKRNPAAKIVWNENDPPFIYAPKRNPIFAFLGKIFHVYKKIAERPYLRVIDRAITLDQWNQRWLAKRGVEATVVRSGVDFENFYAPVRDIAGRRNTIKLLGIGALNVYRRFEDIIDTVEILRRHGHDASATIIAKDIWGEPQCRQFLIRRARSKGVEAAVTFYFDGASNEELRRAYRESHVFILPLYIPPPRNGYGWGLVNFEAMASGLPLIICRTSSACEVLTDSENALFVDPMNPQGIVTQVEKLISSPEFYWRIAIAGQQFVKENISWDKYAENVFKVFRGA
ncbi:MAG: glycosyltransferase family 4 protein [Parcubacteria group bacterium]|nr:glycosyltransferase family 4 protein [Parcubacteria group bacterium]